MKSVVIVLMAVSITGCAKPQQGPSLSETTTWMEQSYNPRDGGSNYGLGYGMQTHYLNGKMTQQFQETLSCIQCKVTLHNHTSPIGIFADVHSDYTLTFSFRDVDPQSIKIHRYDSNKVGNCADPQEVQLFSLNCDQAEITFSARNDAAVIDDDSLTIYEKLQGSDHELRQKTKMSNATIIMDDVEYANRFAAALKHAIELCGGKPSAF